MDNKFSSIGELDISELDLSNDRYSIGKIKRNNSKKVELTNVSDGSYCANGTLEELDIIKGDCSNLDSTAPVINNISIEKTTSSMKVIVSFSEPDSFIESYEFRLLDNNGNEIIGWTSGDTLTGSGNNRITTKTFNNLTQGNTYKVEVRITNTSDNENNIVIDNEETSLNSFNTPEISYNTEDYELSKTVTLTYSSGVTTRYKVVDNNLNTIVAWTTLSGTNETITISNYDYTVMIESSDGTTTLSNSSVIGYIDLEAPTITLKTAGSVTITEGNSNVILSTYFNYSQNGDASITSTCCIDTSNSNAVVTNTNTLSVGTHDITCTATKSTGLSASETKTIVVKTKILAYSIGTAIYYNPQTNETCVYPVSKIGTKTGCMKWYVIDSTSESVKVILDHNTTDTTRWSSTESNETGGDAIKAQLALDTKGWANNLNAHIPSDKEIATAVGIKCQTTVENQCIETSLHLDTKLMDVYPTFRKYTWLYDRTGCNESDDCFSLGYWTSTAHPNNDYSAWGIELNGSFQSIHVDNIEEDYEGYFGLRPVIEIPKTNL